MTYDAQAGLSDKRTKGKFYLIQQAGDDARYTVDGEEVTPTETLEVWDELRKRVQVILDWDRAPFRDIAVLTQGVQERMTNVRAALSKKSA